MHQYLVDHALHNVWCSSRQDNQLIFSPKRITPASGVINYASVLGENLLLPSSKRRYHLFQIGQMDPLALNLLRKIPLWRTQKWFKFSDAVNTVNLEVTIYNANGVVLPRTDCYYIFLDDRALIFAVPEQPRFDVSFGTDQIYFRFYSNVFFYQSDQGQKSISCGNFKPLNNDDVLNMESFLLTKGNLLGHLRVYQNGYLVDRATLGDVQFGDYIEWVHDGSVKKVVQWKLSDLHSFQSDLDNVYKYLLHYEGNDATTIEYQDDIDVHIVFRGVLPFARGVYYNRNRERNHRMVTHRDYSIATEPVISLRDNLALSLNVPVPTLDKVYIQVIIRSDGFERPLVFENQRIFELYKLNETARLTALIGLDANVPEWNCATLESSNYTKVMRSKYFDLDILTAQEAYGYNACSVILGNTPTKTVLSSGNQIAELSYGLQINSTAYEFDESGHLLGWHQHLNDDQYEARNPLCRMVETVVGLGDSTLSCTYGQTLIPMPSMTYGYRVYLCHLVQGIPNEQWVDITNSDSYTVNNGYLNWTDGGDDHWLMVRTDQKFLAYDFELTQNDGLLNFTFMENLSGNPMDEMTPMKIALAQEDIWLNGRALIRNLDYFVIFPQVFITNKTFLNQPSDSAVQNFHIRLRGLPNADMKLDEIEDKGWVYNKSLSNNNKFDLRDDKVLQINVGGSIVHRSDLLFAENRPYQTLLDVMNGKPYQIKDLIVPMLGMTADNTYVMRQKSLEIDKRVSDYMTLKFGVMESDALSAITVRYPVVSPFFSHIVHLLSVGGISFPGDAMLTDMEVMDICEVHLPLLNWDPLKEENFPDENFAYIVPHSNENVYTLNFLSYRFLTQVVRLYGQGKISVTDYVNITNN